MNDTVRTYRNLVSTPIRFIDIIIAHLYVRIGTLLIRGPCLLQLYDLMEIIFQVRNFWKTHNAQRRVKYRRTGVPLRTDNYYNFTIFYVHRLL